MTQTCRKWPPVSRHGVSDLHTVPAGNGKPQEVLLKFAHEVGARMVVMGAFGRSRLRETLLGGVTKALLGHSDVALLMAH
jgi:nucleotide-binding universal stress UspA family protein